MDLHLVERVKASVASETGVKVAKISLKVEVVAQEAVEHSLSDGGVVGGLSWRGQGPTAEILAAGTAAAVLCIGDLQPSDPTVRQGANAGMKDGLAVVPRTAESARPAAGDTTSSLDQVWY
jgi:hypothetical protein